MQLDVFHFIECIVEIRIIHNGPYKTKLQGCVNDLGIQDKRLYFSFENPCYVTQVGLMVFVVAYFLGGILEVLFHQLPAENVILNILYTVSDL